MTAIYQRVLGALSTLYRFPGGRASPTEIELSAPITVVHDVSRQAEIGSGIGREVAPGHWLIGPAHTHVGGDDKWSTTDPRAVIAAAAGIGQPSNDPLAFDVWWLGAYVWSSVATIISAANLAAIFPAMLGQTQQTGCLLANWNGRVSIANIAATDTDDAGTSSTGLTGVGALPILLPFGTLLNARTAAAAATAGDIIVVSRIWVGARGARPPGLA